MTSVSLQQLQLQSSADRYRGYAYAYPHKTAYRALQPPVPMAAAWADEPRDSLFLYVHLPFCEMRCGFCNLFTLAQPRQDLVGEYLRALEKETRIAGTALGTARFAQAAIGGGTPTYLDAAQLERLFDCVARELSAPFGEIPLSVETSPRTATVEKMRLLRQRGATRISMGVQSFVESEVAASGRAQRNSQVQYAIDAIRAADVATMNLDLIYGLPGQTVESWLFSVRTAISHDPEELYLYPLYVRPMTGLARRSIQDPDDLRPRCYAEARELLSSEGYDQVSMRMFRKRGAGAGGGPVYCCQDDGMLGLGCGARSYTRGLHYSREFAVGRDGVADILGNYLARDPEAFDQIDYGCRLDDSEQRRRYVIKSILRTEGLHRADYRARFGSDAMEDIGELRSLVAGAFLQADPGRIRPTQLGIDYSDYIGPALFSGEMRRVMEAFKLR